MSETWVTTAWRCANKSCANIEQQQSTCCITREDCCAVNKNVVNTATQQHWNASLTELGKWWHNKIITSWWSHCDAVMTLKNQHMKEKIVVKTRRLSCWNDDVWMVWPLSKPDKAVKYICEFLKSCTLSSLEISFIINEIMSLSSHHNSSIV